MNTLIAVAIAPVGVGEELSQDVAEVVRVIQNSHLPSKTSAMFTEIEGPWDEVMALVKEATFVLAERGIRTEVLLKADIRPGFEDSMNQKLKRLQEHL
ncbi:MAG: thiamine-binding protein [Tissierellia bacterium]|nr:thiamine-binding protein [Tissierellia bacterium]